MIRRLRTAFLARFDRIGAVVGRTRQRVTFHTLGMMVRLARELGRPEPDSPKVWGLGRALGLTRDDLRTVARITPTRMPWRTRLRVWRGRVQGIGGFLLAALVGAVVEASYRTLAWSLVTFGRVLGAFVRWARARLEA